MLSKSQQRKTVQMETYMTFYEQIFYKVNGTKMYFQLIWKFPKTEE